MPRILSHIFNFGLFFLLGVQQHWAGAGQAGTGLCVAGLATGSEGMEVGGEGQSPLPSPRVAHKACRARED